MPRNPKNINEKLIHTATPCTFYGGVMDGETVLISDTVNRWPVEVRRGKEPVDAVYERVTPSRFEFVRYEYAQ